MVEEDNDANTPRPRGLRIRKQQYSRGLLQVLWWSVFVGYLIYPLFAALGKLFPDVTWLQVQDLIVGGINLTPLVVIVYLAIGFAVIIRKPKTEKQMFATLASCNIATILFMWLSDSGIMVAQLVWFLLLFITQALFGWRWLAVSAIIMLLATIGKFNFDNVPPEAVVQLFVGAIIVIVFAIFVSFMRMIGTIKVDVYERARTREKIQSERLATVINSINDAILNVNNTGEIRLYNAAALSLFDTNVKLDDMRIDDVLKLTDEKGSPVDFASLLKKTSDVTVEYTNFLHTYPNGQKINLYIAISPIRNIFTNNQKSRPVGGVILILRDITRQKTLDDERDEFISVISHELRTPVAVAEAALSTIQFLLKQGGDPQTMTQSLNGAHQQILLLSHMVNDLSALSRAQRDADVDVEDIDVETLVNDLYQKYLPEAQKQHLELETSISAKGVVRTSRMYIEEIMQNLIVNALKYTNEGEVVIGVRPSRGNGKTVEFFVKDAGIGVSVSDQKQIFNKFWRSEDYRTRETSGTGLGLYVAGQLAKRMGTEIKLVSRLNYGSTFSFRLPLVKDKPNKEDKEKPQSESTDSPDADDSNDAKKKPRTS